MGEVADDMVNGFCCSACNSYFLRRHGYPVLCVDCYREERNRVHRRPDTPRATITEVALASPADLSLAGWR